MISVTQVAKELLLQDDVALQALQAGILNVSALAEKMLPQIEQLTYKKVEKSTVVVALTRIINQLGDQKRIKPPVFLDDLTTRSPLCVVTFSKTNQVRQKLQSLNGHLNLNDNAFFAQTQSMSEVTIIAPQAYLQVLLNHFLVTPKKVFINQVGISVRFSESYLEVPNMLFTLQAAMAVHQINCIEIVSTYTEFSFIIDKQYLEAATKTLQKFFTS